MRFILALLVRLLTSRFRSNADPEIQLLVARQRLAVYRRSLPRPRLRLRDRLFWIWLSRLWSGWREALVIVTEHPTAAWTARQPTEAFPWDTAPRYMWRAPPPTRPSSCPRTTRTLPRPIAVAPSRSDPCDAPATSRRAGTSSPVAHRRTASRRWHFREGQEVQARHRGRRPFHLRRARRELQVARARSAAARNCATTRVTARWTSWKAWRTSRPFAKRSVSAARSRSRSITST